MPHLMIHLPQQLLLTGPVHFTWMYPMERQLGEYKDYVTNKSAPEGCIAEAYIAHECVTYMKLYLGASLGAPQAMEELAPRFNLSIVSSDVEVGGARLSAEYALSDEEIAIAHCWICGSHGPSHIWTEVDRRAGYGSHTMTSHDWRIERYELLARWMCMRRLACEEEDFA
ncbi:hypothetical protein ACLB2K_041790 [Fragaria x ananassa]